MLPDETAAALDRGSARIRADRSAHFQQRRAALLPRREDGSVSRLRCRQAASHLYPRLLRPVLHDRPARHARVRGEGARAGPFRRARDRLAEARSVHARARLQRSAAAARAAGDSLSLDVLAVVERRADPLRDDPRPVAQRPLALDRDAASEVGARDGRALPRAGERAPALRDRGQHPRPVSAGRHDDLGHLLGAERVPADVQAGGHVQEPPPRAAAHRHRLTGAAAAVDRARAGAPAGADARDQASTPTRSIRTATAARASACSMRSTGSSQPVRATPRAKPRNWWRKLKIRRRIRYWGRA